MNENPKYIFLNRVCVPLTMECDLSCRYCYRQSARIARIPEFNDLMRSYLGQLDPNRVQALVASGGEAILHFDKVKELYSYAPKEIHTRCMTNGLNLTQEMVDYFNDRDTEVYLSHDGDWTEYLRGVDVLKDPEQLRIIRGAKNLTIGCTCTKKNPDPYKNYLQTKAVLQRDFDFHHNAVYEERFFSYLVEGFDYEAYAVGALHCLMEDVIHTDKIKRIGYGHGKQPLMVNVLPNGDVVGMLEINHKYGTVLDSYETLLAKKQEFGDTHECPDKHCEIFDVCPKRISEQHTPHMCNVQKANTVHRQIFFKNYGRARSWN